MALNSGSCALMLVTLAVHQPLRHDPGAGPPAAVRSENEIWRACITTKCSAP